MIVSEETEKIRFGRAAIRWKIGKKFLLIYLRDLRITICVTYVKPDSRFGFKGLNSIQKKTMKELTVLEQMILAAIIALKEDAYGVSIRKRVEKLRRKKLMYGTLYNALDQLLRKDYVTKTRGTTSSARGGRPRIYYALTSDGKSALRASFNLQRAIWESIPEFRLD